MRERDIENELIRRVKAAGGEIRKVKWIGRNGAPDRLVMLDEREEYPYRNPISFWVELKRPGEVVTAAQEREHALMRECGMCVYVCSTFEELDGLPI